MDRNPIPLRLAFLCWAILWVVLLAVLYWRWHEMPRAVAWSLALVEAFLVPNIRLLRMILGKDPEAQRPFRVGSSQSKRYDRPGTDGR
jgi:hypothetical protein